MCVKKLNQYTGTLDAAQVAAGMNAAIRNANRLAEDAALLLDNKRYCSATALAILSIEESGKISVLRGLATVHSKDQAKQHWREYRSHTKKNFMAAFLDLFSKGARRLDEFAPLFHEGADHPHLIDQVKQIAIYSDCLGNAHWSEPHEVIDESLAHSLVTSASLFAQNKEITPLEVELWIKLVGPYLHDNRELTERAIESWYAEMQRQGLAAPGSNAMAQFINEGVGGSVELTETGSHE